MKKVKIDHDELIEVENENELIEFDLNVVS